VEEHAPTTNFEAAIDALIGSLILVTFFATSTKLKDWKTTGRALRAVSTTIVLKPPS
jgi:hypothetical protein